MAQDYTNLQKMAQQYQQQSPYQPNPKKPSGGFGCVLVLVLAAFFVGMGLLVYFWVYPTYFSGNDKDEISTDKKSGKEKKVSQKSSLNGMMMNAVIAPDEEGNNNLWVMTYKYKNSKYYINTYIYNPEENIILKNFENVSPVFPSITKLLFINNEVWKVNSSSTGLEAEINVYNPESGEEKLNTRGFTEKYPELQSGISNLWVYESPFNISFETKDGRKPVLDLEKDKMYESSTAFRNSFRDEKNEISIFALGVERSGEEARKKLYLVTGPKSNLRDKNISESYFSNPSTLKFITKSEAKSLTDKVFLEGIMTYQDDESCFVFYQNQTGSEAERYLSCIDKTGNILWTVSTESELFEKLRATSKDAFSTMFFIKSNVHVSRSGDLVLLVYDRFGFMGFDYKTGKKTFEVELSN
ncbi:MAG: hypothetical protein WC358_02525 [Ignavibacteria bacterium]|jgi:hypothetical protein